MDYTFLLFLLVIVGGISALFIVQYKYLAGQRAKIRGIAESIHADKYRGFGNAEFSGTINNVKYRVIFLKPQGGHGPRNVYRSGKLSFCIFLDRGQSKLRFTIINKKNWQKQSPLDVLFLKKVLSGFSEFDVDYIVRTNSEDELMKVLRVDKKRAELLSICGEGYGAKLTEKYLYLERRISEYYRCDILSQKEVIALMIDKCKTRHELFSVSYP